MSRHVVLVVGPDAEVPPVLTALRAVGFEAWADQMERVAGDIVSLGWADALVVIDPTDHQQAADLHQLAGFPGPSVLSVSAALPAPAIADLYERGFDAVVSWPAPSCELAARVRRLFEAQASVRSRDIRRQHSAQQGRTPVRLAAHPRYAGVRRA